MRCSTDQIPIRKEDRNLTYFTPRNHDIPNSQYSDNDDDIDSDLDRSENLSGYMAASHNSQCDSDSFNHNLSSEVDSFTRTKHIRSLTPDPVPANAYPNTRNDWSGKHIACLVVALVAMVLGFALNYTTETTAVVQPTCNFRGLAAKFPNQNERFWKRLQLGTESVLNKNTPSVFLLVHKEDRTKLIDQIVNMASKCMGSQADPLILSHSYFASPDMLTDYGVAINQIRPKLITSQVLLITNLNKIKATVAQAFHTICDPITPLVGRSVIFLTVRMDLNDKESHSLLNQVEKLLRNDWRDLDENLIQPLLTRVTDQVLLLQ